MRITYFLVDVFAERPLSGNPLAVVPDSDGLDDKTMQEISRELGQAETTFILRSEGGDGWRLRCFTSAGHEVFGAGHNSLGAWWWLADAGKLRLVDGPNAFVQEIGDRVLPVEVRYEEDEVTSIVLDQSPPDFGAVWTDFVRLAEALRLNIEDLDQGAPSQVVSTGAGHLLVPVKSMAAVARSAPDSDRLGALLRAAGGEGCYVYSLESISAQSIAHARFFNPSMGLLEDSATGTAAGPLACQLVRLGIANTDSRIRIEQGFEMQRPSILTLEVQDDLVRLVGRAIVVSEASLLIA